MILTETVMGEMAVAIKLVRTCYACPEQYDAYDGEARVGYLRLRHGCFTVECPWEGGTPVYIAATVGDGMFGEEERDYHMRFAVDAIQKWLRGEKPLVPPDVEYEIK